jgi:hypothetical protein
MTVVMHPCGYPLIDQLSMLHVTAGWWCAFLPVQEHAEGAVQCSKWMYMYYTFGTVHMPPALQNTAVASWLVTVMTYTP